MDVLHEKIMKEKNDRGVKQTSKKNYRDFD